MSWLSSAQPGVLLSGRTAPDREHAFDAGISGHSRSTPCPTIPVAPNL